MTLTLLAIAGGLALLVWSADRFIDGAAATAAYAGMPPLLIGMVIVGFGTSAPEMVVSAIAAMDGNPGLALGNAVGSNIVNTGLILGVTALVAPIMVHSNIVRRELPLLLGISLLAGFMLLDDNLTRLESVTLILGFFALIGWSVFTAVRNREDVLAAEMTQELSSQRLSRAQAAFWLLAGLVLLVISSRVLVWGAINFARTLGISDLIIGLTIVALGTSLPELAASVMAARKGEHDIAIGNVVGSNMFNLLAVIGIAGAISPLQQVPAGLMSRDWPTMLGMTMLLLAMAYGFRRQGRINRLEGTLLLTLFIGYNSYLLMTLRT